MLDALARALRLTPADRAHLHHLVHGETSREHIAETVAPAVAELVERLDPSPTYLTGRRFDVLASNRAARALWTDWHMLPREQRNMLWWMFTDPHARGVLVEWERGAFLLLARYRAAAARHPGDPAFDELTARLHAASSEAREWWARHEVASLSSGTKRLYHPQLGELELRHVVLQVAVDPEQKLVTFSATADDQARIVRVLER